ncbi:hypothetical protein ADK70_38540 [Streptomyces rimosus subsp. pseudoverticillatus]|uniref:hypothetical protein n=1 Tax=Streptomyces rimosus TaxID=1927 RepID=UPI0006C6094F|nr:hypothetical protein [Streptomyces rimosus]KOT76378.1 hypothetical protein ADK70_38540 [Streptomyces rimosus subsp. pseudoverticillatus]
MARIRTIKPEAFESEDLASVSVTAERTFYGLLTLADDSGRFRDHPAIIAGRLWALRAEHTAAHVAADLEQLAGAGLICRYTGCDGRTYLHIVTWQRHQKIDRPSASRVPRCPEHQARQKCGGCAGEPCPAAVPTVPRPIRRGFDRHVSSGSPGEPDATEAEQPSDASGTCEPAAPGEGATQVPDEPAGQKVVAEGSASPREGSPSGPRISDPGSVPSGRPAPAPDATAEPVTAKHLVAEYVSACAHRPPKDKLGHLGRQVRRLLDEGFQPEPIRTALERLRVKGLHPSVLPSLVDEVLNAEVPPSASGAGPWASHHSASYVPYFNATPAPTTFGGRP